jgi:predicted DCC family thiol-disulfide oxidoreductase YuxK
MDSRAALVLYDADCGVCGRLADALIRHGVRVAPIRSATGELQLRDLAHASREATVHVLDGHGRRRSGAEALPSILRSLPRLAWTARLVAAHPAASRLGYAAVARHRRVLSRILGLRACTPGRVVRGD